MRGAGLAVAFIVTAVLDRFLSHVFAQPGLSLADPVTIGVTLALGTSLGLGVANYQAGRQAAQHEKDLEKQQAEQLQKEQAARAAESARQAVSGQGFGFSDASVIATGLGFGGGNHNTGFGNVGSQGGQQTTLGGS